MTRPTFRMIADRAGVSLATVERVLNGRGGVRGDKVQAILAAAKALGYDRRLPEEHRNITRVELILARPQTTFFTRLINAFVRTAETLDPNIVIHRTLIAQDPQECVARIRATNFRRAGLIITAPDHPDVRDALLSVQESGLPIVQLVTRTKDLQADYVGIDNYAAGRSAALFMSTMSRRKGVVAALAPFDRYEAHKQRLRGFSDYFDAFPNPDLDFRQIILAQEQGHFGTSELQEILDQDVPLAGFYNCAGLNAPLCEMLRQHPLGRDIFFVGHELTDFSRAALVDGTMNVVLDQAPEIQARQALELMLARIGILSGSVENPPIRFVTVTAHSL